MTKFLTDLLNEGHGNKTIFNGFTTEEKTALDELIEYKIVNGEVPEAFRKGAADVRSLIKEKLPILEAYKLELKKEKEKQQQEEEKEQNELINQAMKFMRGRFKMATIKIFFKLDLSETQSYPEALARLKEHHDGLKRQYLIPFLKLWGVDDEKIQNKIHQLALEILYADLFNLPSCVDSLEGSSQFASYCRAIAVRYKQDIFSFDITHKDKVVLDLMQKRKDEVISTTAKAEARSAGMDEKEAVQMFEKNFAVVITELMTGILIA